ncbi:MAG TPA: N-acetylmuramoyl-L-alanine amidase, partial [Bacteroidota bacterium]|nr:N-acetylmuramoyl-L-alanine amidase [Bacteroidota bacterium]
IFTKEPVRNTHIGMFTRNGKIYGSVNDLASTLKLNTYYNAETKKLELRGEIYSLKMTSNNIFIVMTDKERNASVVQLSLSVLYAANSFFVPIEDFIPVFDEIVPEEVLFDRAKQQITVNRSTPVSPFDVTGLSFEPKINGLLIRVQCAKKLTDYTSWLKPIGEDTWLYITLANAKADLSTLNKITPSGIIKDIMVFQTPTAVQLTFKIKGHINNSELLPAEGNRDILVAIHTPTEEQVAVRTARNYERTLERERDRWKLDVVVIDPGHGGDDPGAIGVNRTREKDITLAISKKLGKLIEQQLPDVKIVYTRTGDNFIELYRRGQIANQQGGKLFISIHCNATPRKSNSAKGFEIYLLRPGKTDHAVRLAERENAVVKLEEGYEQRYQQLTEENFILLTMAQSAYAKYSEQFADILQQEMGKHLNLENDGVKQAGFYVLVGASMPNVLIETAYLSNRQDEKFLKNSKGQQQIAQAIFNGVKRYKQEYEKTLEKGKDSGSH